MNNIITIKDKSNNLIDIANYPGLKINFLGNNSRVIIENPVRINKLNAWIGNDCEVYIGNSVDVRGYLHIFASANKSRIRIGDKCSFTGVTIRMESEPNLEVEIGNRCLFSDKIIIRSSDSHTIFDCKTKVPLNVPRKVKIGNHVWIGYGVNILKNTLLPNNCVGATQSLVTKEFHDDNCVIGGIPAKILRTNINWDWNNTSTYLDRVIKTF